MRPAAGDGLRPPSLLRVTARRSYIAGRFYLFYGIGISLILALALNFAKGSAFASAFPLFLPIFGIVGSLGAVMVFTNDRLKGVLEYLMAYGISPRGLFVQTLLVTLLLSSIVLAVAIGVGLGLYLAMGNALTVQLALALGVYAVPMCYASCALACAIGMYWTALSSPRAGMNSPVGLIPLIGIIPPLIGVLLISVLAATGTFSGATATDVAAGILVLVIGVIAIVLVTFVGRLLDRERLLSPA